MNSTTLISIVLLSFVVSSLALNENKTEIAVSTTRGPIVGFLDVVKSNEDGANVNISHFLGINYAKSPTGDFRFAHPDYSDWTFPQDVKEFDKWCFQDGNGDYSNMDESCIGANVWSPITSNESVTAQYGVLIFIHGGSFESGYAANPLYNPVFLSSYEKLVVSTVQYRLGVFGFLRFDDTIVPGNMGLKDQALGIQFISENAAAFGGNVSTVTLMGLDAGAVSAGYHLLNENTKKYFHRLILSGGSPLAYWAIQENTKDVEATSIGFATLSVGCKVPDIGPPNITALRECMTGYSASYLIEKQARVNRIFSGIEFPPVIDGDYIKEDPVAAIRRGAFDNIDIMIGITNKEAAVQIDTALHAQNLTRENLANLTIYEQVLGNQFYYFDRVPERLSSVAKKVLVDELTHQGDPSGENHYQGWSDAASDRLYVCGANDFAHNAAAKPNSNLYFYVFSEPDNNANGYIGASHGMDSQYLLGRPVGDGQIYKPEQVLLSARMMDYVQRFVNVGDPVPRDDANPVWPPYTVEKQGYHNFSTVAGDTGPKYYGFRRNQCGFWDHTMKFVNQLVESNSDPVEPVFVKKHVVKRSLVQVVAELPEVCKTHLNDVSSALLGVLLSTNVITFCVIGYLTFRFMSLKRSNAP